MPDKSQYFHLMQKSSIAIKHSCSLICNIDQNVLIQPGVLKGYCGIIVMAESLISVVSQYDVDCRYHSKACLTSRKRMVALTRDA